MSTQVETWRVSTPEGVFETDLETLKQWIAEGCVLPTDKVSKGNLKWIDAGLAPMLRSAFAGEIQVGDPVASQEPFLDPSSPPPDQSQLWPPDSSSYEPSNFTSSTSASICLNHPERVSKYICHVCSKAFCEECVNFVGTSRVALCPLCGDLCKLFEQVQSKAIRQQFQSSGFGFKDLGRAISYPFQHKVALLFGAALYGFLLLAGFRGRILASVIMFGCISHVISQVAWGRLHRSFMPDFSAFSLWDDLVVPLSLGIGVAIVTWGPTIALMLILIFGVSGGPGFSPTSGLQPENEPSANQITPDELAPLADPEADPTKLAEANKKLQQLRPGHQISQEAERSKKELSDPMADLRVFAGYLQASIAIVLLLLVSLLWGIFYYPMALAVAGYTESFASVINPLVGLDTIRRMGGTYFKAFGMVIMVQVAGVIAGVFVALVTAPFALPFFGNLPAMVIDGSVTFYFNLVIACVLGLALHKCADRLGIAAT